MPVIRGLKAEIIADEQPLLELADTTPQAPESNHASVYLEVNVPSRFSIRITIPADWTLGEALVLQLETDGTCLPQRWDKDRDRWLGTGAAINMTSVKHERFGQRFQSFFRFSPLNIGKDFLCSNLFSWDANMLC